MFNFIIVDDKNFYLEKIGDYINELMKDLNYKHKLYKFKEYDNNFYKLTLKQMENKIYILDIETNDGNGLDEAQNIYDMDPESKVILISAYENRYYSRMIRHPNFYIGFITKDQKIENFKMDIFKYINKVIYEYMKKIDITIRYNNNIQKLCTNDITFIEVNNRNTIIHIYKKESIISKIPLKIFEEKLPNYFIRTHKSCIININHVNKFDSNDNVIIFNDDSETDLVSRTYKKDIINILNKLSINVITKKNNDKSYIQT